MGSSGLVLFRVGRSGRSEGSVRKGLSCQLLCRVGFGASIDRTLHQLARVQHQNHEKLARIGPVIIIECGKATLGVTRAGRYRYRFVAKYSFFFFRFRFR